MRTRERRVKAVPWEQQEKKALKELHKRTLKLAVEYYNEAQAKSIDHKVPHGTLRSIIKRLGSPPWLTRDKINYAIKAQAKVPQQPTEVVVNNNDDSPTNISSITRTNDNSGGERTNLGGRPMGTNKEKDEKYDLVMKAKIIAAEKVQNIKRSAQKKGVKAAKGAYDEAVKEALQAVGLPYDEYVDQVPVATLLSRVYNGNIHRYQGSYSQQSPMAPVEPYLVDLCRQLNRMGESLTRSQLLALANDLIKDKPIEAAVKEFKRKICGSTDKESNVLLGKKYFTNFMKRHKDILHTSTKIVKKDINRLEWATYDNLEKMYDLIYDLMVESGIAHKLPEKVYFKNDGSIGNENDFVGLPSDVKLVHPQYLIFVDETGCNTNMGAEGNKTRQQVVASKGSEGRKKAITTDICYTTLGFTAATGEPVLCVVIFQTTSPIGAIPKAWVSGLDIFKITPEMETMDNQQLLESVSNNDGAANGGPKCFFRGKTLNCLVFGSKYGGITGPILADCLKYIDGCNVYSRSNGLKPFILLDGHWSRFDVAFLEYLRDDNHPWTAGIGLPYATHIWQVGDSKQQNGRYKHMLSVAKEALMVEKTRRKLPLVFKPTDVMPIVSKAWEQSFARVDTNRKAISDRGWFPLNRNLLTKQDVLSTKRESTSNDEIDNNSPLCPIVPVQLNADNGVAATYIDSILEQRSKELAQAQMQQRDQQSTATRRVLERTKKLTSGTAFAHGLVGIHSDAVWEHTFAYNANKNEKEETKQRKRKEDQNKR